MGKKRNTRPWLITLVALADDIAIIVLIFLVLFLVGVKVSVPVLVITGIAMAAGIYFLHKAVVLSLRRRLVTGAEGMVGETGVVMEALDPEGSVIVKGEYWKAVSHHGRIEKGRGIEVMAINGLTLEVKEKNNA